MAAGGFDIARAGWLYRQSSVLHRWKKNWFVLDREGDLRYFENPDQPKAEERIVVRAAVVAINAGFQCRKADNPEGSSATSACFLELVMRDRESILLCAESSDEMKAWQIALEEARTLASNTVGTRTTTTTTTIIAPPGYVNYGSPYASYGSPYASCGYPGQVLNPPPAQVIRTADGNTTTIVNAPPYQQVVYVDDGPHRYRPYSYGSVYPAPFFFW